MGVFQFIIIIFKKFPRLVFLTNLLFILTSLAGMVSIICVAPIVDIITHPDFQGISPLTSKIIAVSNFFGVLPSLTNWGIIFTVFIFFSSLFQVYGRYLIFRTCYSMAGGILEDSFRDFFNSRYYFFSTQKHGDLINSFLREMNIILSSLQSMGIFFSSIFQ